MCVYLLITTYVLMIFQTEEAKGDSPGTADVLFDLLDNSDLTMKDQASVNKLSQELIGFANSLLKSPGTPAPTTGKEQVTSNHRLVWKTAEEKVNIESTRRVFGRLGETVQVLIPWRGRPITMFCLTPQLQQRGVIINPSTQWVKEGDSPVSMEGEGTQFKVRQDGSLIVLNWENQQFSGFYSCTMTFGQREAQHKLMLRFCLVVYHIPLKSLQVAAQLKTTTCENGSVMNSAAIRSSLDFMCRQLSCEVTDVTSECRQNTEESQRGLYQLQLNITVWPQSRGLSAPCMSWRNCWIEEILRQAYQNIRILLTQSPELLKPFNKIPPLYSTPDSFQAVKVDHCLKGMGKPPVERSLCGDCCVTCRPGSYSPDWTSICIPCPVNSYQDAFGKSECHWCPAGLLTNGTGAKSVSDCFEDNNRRRTEINIKKGKRANIPMDTKVTDSKVLQRVNMTEIVVTISVCSMVFLIVTVAILFCLLKLIGRDFYVK